MPAIIVEQREFVRFAPTTGSPLTASDTPPDGWRYPGAVWLFDPWTGNERPHKDVMADPQGRLIVPFTLPGKPGPVEVVQEQPAAALGAALAAGLEAQQTDIDATLSERGARYGKFKDHAVIAQRMKDEMRRTDGWHRLGASGREALEMVVHKIARILNGDPTYADSWVDIAGYAKLVADEVQGVVR
jgi:hypothetical protein